MGKIKESKLFEMMTDILVTLSPVEFVEEINRALGANYTINDIEWDGCHSVDYERQ